METYRLWYSSFDYPQVLQCILVHSNMRSFEDIGSLFLLCVRCPNTNSGAKNSMLRVQLSRPQRGYYLNIRLGTAGLQTPAESPTQRVDALCVIRPTT